MAPYSEKSTGELSALLAKLRSEYEAIRGLNLKLDMSRGKPGADQLDLSVEILTCVSSSELCKTEEGVDCRNYGLLDGIPAARRLFAGMLGVRPEEIIIGGNSSLNMMYDTIARAMTHGILGSTPWCRLDKVKFLCPSPGYDRHFAVTGHFGIELVTVEMRDDGPDMDAVERLVRDPAVKGIWCVPKYSNPTGVTYSDAVVERFAALKPVADDFRIYWDNAYCVHHLYDEHDKLLNLMDACRKNGSEDLPFIFGSTSKITFPGSGVAMMAASQRNLTAIKKQLSVQTIGPDKLNQLRHVRYFKNPAGINAHMRRHAELIRPKFEAVLAELERKLAGTGLAEWTKPRGGYFLSLDVPDGCAKRVVALCKDAGVKFTPAGATFPYGCDPRDRNIRIAPTYPPVEELRKAVSLLCLCVRITGIEKLLEERRAEGNRPEAV